MNSQSTDLSRAWHIVAILFVIIILVHIPILWLRVNQANQTLHNLVPTCCDDQDYQILAINMLYGKGYSNTISVSWNLYHLDLDTPYSNSLKANFDANGPQQPIQDFYRNPGFPFLLTLTYKIFGNTVLNARRMLAMQGIVTALLLLFTGINFGKWPGLIAGELTAIYYLNFQPGLIQPSFVSYGALMSEAPTAFWVALFCLAFTYYLKKRERLTYLVIAAIALAGMVLTRANLVLALPFLLVYLKLIRCKLSRIAIFAIIAIIPAVIWSVYATNTSRRLVLFSTQSDTLFAQTNNMEVITGSIQNSPGDWAPGYAVDENGKIYITYSNAPKPGESGWVKGLTFLATHLNLVPQLYYLKAFAGFWNYYGFSVNPLQPERFHLLGVGFLLAAIGLRTGSRNFKTFSSSYSAVTVLVLLLVLLVGGNHLPFIATILTWTTILICAIFRPYGQIFKLNFIPPTWFLSFVAAHLIVTLLFFGIRLHWPLDSDLMLFGLIGVFILVEQFLIKLAKHGVLMPASL